MKVIRIDNDRSRAKSFIILYMPLGHLAIINSDSEEKILLRMLQEGKIDVAWLGLHDYFEEGDWVNR